MYGTSCEFLKKKVEEFDFDFILKVEAYSIQSMMNNFVCLNFEKWNLSRLRFFWVHWEYFFSALRDVIHKYLK